MKGTRRSRVAKVLRPTFEAILLVSSVLLGLGIVGSCAASGASSGPGAASLSILGGAVFAIVLVGAVFLFTSMSRDLRRLREHYVEGDEAGAQSLDTTRSEESARVDA